VVVPAGHWQAARPVGPRHALVSCTVGPGFDFADFEMARAEDLLKLRPDLTSLIRSLCRPSRAAG
jgi:predicted cupin superfamily sugar epimerase